MNSKIASILFDEGVYLINDQNKNQDNDLIDLRGNPNSNVLCIFLNENNQYPKDEELTLADNIMKAINMNKYAWSDDFQAIELFQDKFEFMFLFQSLDFKTSKNNTIHEWISNSNSKLLRTYSLEDLITDKEKKKDLWAILIALKK